MRRSARGFSLLEVMVAMAVLGLGLTTILSSQAGLFNTSQRGANMTLAATLGRCKMSELEALLLRDGFPLTDERDEGSCCGDEETSGFRCSWTVDTVVLPEIETDADGGLSVEGEGMMGFADGGGLPSAGLALDGGLNMNTPSSPLSLLGGALPGAPTGDGDPLSTMAGESGGVMGIATMAIGMVYPTLKPMLEASIRRVVVTVTWREGVNQRSFDLAQYLTNPQQGGMLADLEAAGLGSAAPVGSGGPGSGAPTGLFGNRPLPLRSGADSLTTPLGGEVKP
jgi:general secretion pathway protein I